MVATLRIDGAHASAGGLDRSAECGARGHRDVHATSIPRCASAVGRPAAGGVAAPAPAARRLAAWVLAAAPRCRSARAPAPAPRSLIAAVALALTLSAMFAIPSGASAQPIQPGQKLTGAGEIGAGKFGSGVALSTDGDTAVVGAPQNADGAGAAWVWTRSESSWGQQTELTAPEGAGDGHFGRSVAVSASGTTALVGAPASRGYRGAAWVFTRSGSSWGQPAELTGGEAGRPGLFGRAVALSGDGNTAVIAAPLEDGGVGKVWVFTRSGSSWSEQAELTGGEGIGDSQFGCSVAVSDDGDTVIVGGRFDDGGVGAAWVFTRSGSVWTQDGPKLTGTEEEGDGQFGYSVALSAEGETAMVGGPRDDEGTGAAWVFTRSGAEWLGQGAKLTSQTTARENWFGSSVALSANGSVALVGDFAAYRRVGAAWVFGRSGSEWHREGIFLTPEHAENGGAAEEKEADGEEEEAGEVGEPRFGRSVALSGDGATALVGGPRAEEDVGAAWLFEGAPVVHELEEPDGSGHGTGKKEKQPPPPPSSTEQTSLSGAGTTAKSEVLASKVVQPVAATASCRLVAGSRVAVSRSGRASVKLLCDGNHKASGKLTLTVTKRVKLRASGRGAAAKTRTITKTITIATATFAVAPGKTVTDTLPLTKTGRAFLTAGHGRLTAVAHLAKLSPTPAQTHTATVHLLLQKPASKKAPKK